MAAHVLAHCIASASTAMILSGWDRYEENMVEILNPCHAEFVWETLKIYLHYLLFLNTEIA